MHWNSFPRSIGFAAGAALGWWILQPLAIAVLGTHEAARLYLTVIAPLYVLGLGPQRGRALRASLMLGAVATCLWMLPLRLATTAAILAAGIGLTRSAMLHRARPLRAWLAEMILLGAGLGLGTLLIQSAPASLAYGLWGFFLVQSGFFLLGGVAARGAEMARDPFEQACRQLDALLS